MNIEYAIIGSLGILFATAILFYPTSHWGAVSAKKILKPGMDLNVSRQESIMWNH